MHWPSFRRLVTLPFTETVVSSVLGGILYALDHREATGLLTFSFGVVLGASRLAFTESLRRRLSPLSRLCSFVDLTSKTPLPQFQEIASVYIRINQPDFRLLKEAIVEEASSHLLQLAQQGKSRELATSEYYRWLYSMLESQKGGEVWAVSTMNPLEWDESPTRAQVYTI